MTTAATHSLAARVVPRLYRDSVTLMSLAAALERRAGVTRAGVVMGTPGNLAILERSAMLPAGVAPAPDDLVVVVRGVDEATVAAALDAAGAALEAVDPDRGPRREHVPRTVAEGLAADPALTVAVVSTAGPYAPVVVEQALRSGLHVLCFSDNVPTADEVRLKQLAARRGLLLMGPDCGTAILGGVPLGFANAVRRGPVGIVAASGTGAQEVACLLHRAGTGISELVGVGGRDLSTAVGGTMTHLALDLLARDAATEVVVVVSKPPAPEVARRLLARLAALGKPAVACLLGQDDTDGPVPVRGTLEGGARAAAALVGAVLDLAPVTPGPVTLPDVTPPAGVLGLYTGGTLAAEARVVLARAGVPAQVLDLGDDEHTVGRPHPMIDPAPRAALVAEAGARPDVGVLLVDLVLGHGAAADPATPLADAAAEAVRAAACDGRGLVVLASVCGTDDDPQDLAAARRALTRAGVVLHVSNAAAARTAAAVASRARSTA